MIQTIKAREILKLSAQKLPDSKIRHLADQNEYGCAVATAWVFIGTGSKDVRRTDFSHVLLQKTPQKIINYKIDVRLLMCEKCKKIGDRRYLECILPHKK